MKSTELLFFLSTCIVLTFGYNFSLVSVDTSAFTSCSDEFACMLPNVTTAFSIQLKNIGTETWNVGDVVLSYNTATCSVDSDCLEIPDLQMEGATSVAPNDVAAFSGSIKSNFVIGRHFLHFNASHQSTFFGTTISLHIDISCSDGIFCNGKIKIILVIFIMSYFLGIERFDLGLNECVAGPNPCEDNNNCTEDFCDNSGLCHYEVDPDDPSCVVCYESSSCTPNCEGKQL